MEEIIQKEIKKGVIPEQCMDMVIAICDIAMQNDHFYTEVNPFSDNSGAFKIWHDAPTGKIGFASKNEYDEGTEYSI